MSVSIASIRTLLLAIFMLMVGSGFLSTLIAVRLEQANAPSLVIGLAATSYFSGLMLGSMRFNKVIAEVGHIRAFAAFVTMYSASSLIYTLTDSVTLWIILRFLDGCVMAGVYVCLESWLNKQATPTNRSVILAIYMIALYAGQAAGQFLLNLGENEPNLPFILSAIILSIALLPVLLTKMAQPEIEKFASFSVPKLYAASPLGIAGTLMTGIMLGAFYAVGAVYVQRIGLPLSQVALFNACVIAGGVAMQYPLGMLSDRFDRRKVIIGCFFIVAVISLIIILAPLSAYGVIAMGGLFGGFSFALYPLCVAHMNDHVEEDERVGASSGLVLIYSLGAMAGPMAGSLGLSLFGPKGLFIIIGAVALFGAIFGMLRVIARAPVPADEQQDFQSLPRTTPMIAVIEGEDDA
jgi:MFS family permease